MTSAVKTEKEGKMHDFNSKKKKVKKKKKKTIIKQKGIKRIVGGKLKQNNVPCFCTHQYYEFSPFFFPKLY